MIFHNTKLINLGGDRGLPFLFVLLVVSFSSPRDADNLSLRFENVCISRRGLLFYCTSFWNLHITLLPPAMDILEKYDYNLPIQEMHIYNRNLQTIQYRAGIEKHISSHVGRHTFGTVCINQHIPIEVVKEFMGHKDIKTTSIYAKILDKTVNKEFDKLKNVF